MLFTKTLAFSSLILLAAAQGDAVFKGLPDDGRTRTPTSTSKLMSRRDLNKRCTGTCEECFGGGYTLCPGSAIYCYLPGDDTYGLDSCDLDSSDDGLSTTNTATAPASTSTSLSGLDDICYQTGATCASCFGSSYLECPDGYHCYDPSDPLYDTCPEESTSSGGGGSSSSSTCAEIYGEGNIPCGSDSCYNPDDGESCCAGGYYCEDGYTCSSTLGKCSYVGSSSSFGTTTSDLVFTTPTSALFSSTRSTIATTTSTDTSLETGVSQFSESNGASGFGAAKGLLIAAGVGVLVL
ncbi:hypothetical protein AYO21_00372 [Fonsecaea monophora]|uniref:Unplaced genomic scaffold supercont1.2, whole genome shotgun sequence n=2 Tax=Fonsecaea TaxID=40354 RepID=A0A0D2GXR2_9EURO|nr:uncharacterized protein Z517_02660 [Fonsecaea pedrosoi CBS 271.37]XP_022517688.1 hypothetical protein AYO21_00372 [Fonsecaea monophora]KAH0832722.1 hypothetical protein FOPE_01396 [Fonsecaea pedrosoi]KIW83415.1 hypothetical protein Z517_02660 [Fonsecaea pedrosoi CBS 271.37]OAG45736.1 hypothetical protein AYO21_00372 [Fonsecaea monophora]